LKHSNLLKHENISDDDSFKKRKISDESNEINKKVFKKFVESITSEKVINEIIKEMLK